MNTQMHTWNKGYNPTNAIISLPIGSEIVRHGMRGNRATVWFRFPFGNEKLPWEKRNVLEHIVPVAAETVAPVAATTKLCCVEGCTVKVHAGGMCRKHYDAKRRAK